MIEKMINSECNREWDHNYLFSISVMHGKSFGFDSSDLVPKWYDYFHCTIVLCDFHFNVLNDNGDYLSFCCCAEADAIILKTATMSHCHKCVMMIVSQ